MVTGTSVLGVKFTGGVIIAADMLGSYGSLARFRNISRLMKVSSSLFVLIVFKLTGPTWIHIFPDSIPTAPLLFLIITLTRVWLDFVVYTLLLWTLSEDSTPLWMWPDCVLTVSVAFRWITAPSWERLGTTPTTSIWSRLSSRWCKCRRAARWG